MERPLLLASYDPYDLAVKITKKYVLKYGNS